MTGAEKIRVVDAAGLQGIAMTTADMIIVVDRDTTIVNGTLPMPASPIEGQIFIVTSKIAITNLTLNAAGKTINGGIITLPVNGAAGWIFDTVANAWFVFINPQGAAPATAWGSITGTLSDQTDLVNASALKAPLESPTFTGNVTFPTGNIGIPIYSRVSGSNATTTGQVLVTITGLQQALEANAVYEFESNMSCSTSAVTTGIGYGVNFSAAGATIEANIVASSSTTATKMERINALNTTTSAFLATSNQHGGVVIRGTIVVGGNAGNLLIQHRKITSGTSTVFINSFLKVTRVV